MGSMVLAGWHESRGARMGLVQGAPVVMGYGRGETEYGALSGTVGWMDASSRGRLVLLGGDRRRMLNGQVTNQVKDLESGQGCYAFLVNAKARILSDLNIFALADELLLDCEPGMGEKVAARLEQFILSEDVQVVDAAPHYGLLTVQGPRAERAVAAMGWECPLPETSMSWVTVGDGGQGVIYLMRHARLGSDGFDLFVPVGGMEAMAERLEGVVREAGGCAVGEEAWEVVRVEAGVPRYGVDMDETNLAPETGLEARAISYTKGCYSGQEVIARIRTYGQVAKALRGLKLEGEWEVLPGRGTKLYRGTKDVGFLTSVVRSPAWGGVVALGYVRRECHGPGSEMAVGGVEGPKATVVPVPFVGRMLA